MDAVIENLNKEDLIDIFIRYGLYFAAVFQLICLIACIYLPNNMPSNTNVEDNTENDDCNNDQHGTNNQKRFHYKNRKLEKKKRR